jgi:hypothetical protein
MTARQPRRPSRMQPLHAWLLAALLLAAQALGLAHRVAHAPGLPAAASAQATVLASADVHAHADADAAAHAPHEAGSADCRLIDQLAHADALCGSASLPPALLSATTLGTLADLPVLPLGSAAAYLARGPPASA